METSVPDWGQFTQIQDGHIMLNQPSKLGEGTSHNSTTTVLVKTKSVPFGS